MELFMFDEKRNTLYINTDAIMCDLTNMTFKERSVAIRKHFALSMQERIELSNYRVQIENEIKKHPNCKLSEFSNL